VVAARKYFTYVWKVNG